MKKLFWVGIGIGVGVLAARKLTEAKDLAGPDGLNRTVGRLGDSLHELRRGLPRRHERTRNRTAPGPGPG